MLTTAKPIFTGVPATFCDPVGLADQQARGVVALIVVHYGAANGDRSGMDRAGTNAGTPPDDALAVLGGAYDAFVAVSGQLLAVARTTPDYRFPVMPATALARFLAHRDAGRPATLSLYELSEDDCARFLETVFYAECLKLHVDGADSAALVAQQITRSGCGNGILELNDFSDPAAPRVRLLDLDHLAASIGTAPPTEPVPGGTVDPGGLAAVLAGHLHGVLGRVLLYDRAKNRAAMPGRAGRAFDLLGAVDEANRLAAARRGRPGAEHASTERQAEQATRRVSAELRASAPDDQAEAVETYLRDRAERPRLVEPDHPHAVGLGALVAELQGQPSAEAFDLSTLLTGAAKPAAAAKEPAAPAQPTAAAPVPLPPSALTVVDLTTPPPPTVHAAPPVPTPVGTRPVVAGQPTPARAAALPGAATGLAMPPALAAPAPVAAPSAPATPPPAPTPASAPSAPARTRHTLATELDRLRVDVFEALEEAVGRERAVLHEEHVLQENGFASPVSSEHTAAYLRALLTENPPKRWAFFKHNRKKTYENVAGKLLAFHAANVHVDRPDARQALHEITKLWTRIHR